MRTTFSRRVVIAAVAATATATATGVATPAANAETLTGTFSIDSGSYFRMILPSGSTSGPFLANGNSTNSDKTITPLSGSLTSGS